MELREAGYSFAQIAGELKISISWCCRASTSSPKSRPRPSSTRLDTMLSAILPDAAGGDQNAVNTVIRLMDRRARYLGSISCRRRGRRAMRRRDWTSPSISSARMAPKSSTQNMNAQEEWLKRQSLGDVIPDSFHPLVTTKARYKGIGGGRG
jgi:hypothetical protein